MSKKYDKNTTILYTLIILITICFMSTCIYMNHKNYNNDKMHEGFDNHHDPDKIHYVYWTGGYDSTFRVCEMLIDEGKIVQPIYMSLVLDNDCATEETCNKLWIRRNRKEEIGAMNKVRQMLAEKFPFTRKTLLQTIEVDSPINDNDFNYEYENLFYKDNLWPRKRKTHQYLFLSKYAFYHKRPIDIGVIGLHEGSKFIRFLKSNLVRKNNNYVLEDKNHPLGYLQFPLFGRSKELLLEQAKQGRYDEILSATWSCWFPVNGKPCGKCMMCRERILKHPSE